MVTLITKKQENSDIDNLNNMWYWNDQRKLLESRSSTPCNKTRQIRTLMNKHQPSDRLKSYRGAVGKLVTLRTLSAVQEWSMDSIIERAYTTMVEQLLEHPPSCDFAKYW